MDFRRCGWQQMEGRMEDDKTYYRPDPFFDYSFIHTSALSLDSWILS